MRTALPVICLTLGLAMAESPEQKSSDASVGTLTVDVHGLKSDAGKVRFALFDSEADYLKHPVRVAVLPIENGRCRWVVDDLPLGEYALAVHHDVNGNGVMERHWYGKPKEPGGFANDAPAKFGPAKYSKAKFAVTSAGKTLQVTVR